MVTSGGSLCVVAGFTGTRLLTGIAPGTALGLDVVCAVLGTRALDGILGPGTALGLAAMVTGIRPRTPRLLLLTTILLPETFLLHQPTGKPLP